MTLKRDENKSVLVEDWAVSYAKAYNHSIGSGSFGKVWLVRARHNGKYFAMKEIDLQQEILRCSIINKAYALDEGAKFIALGV